MGATMTSSSATVTIREADTIWREQGGWFDARWHFSFDRYRDPEQMGSEHSVCSTTTGSSGERSGRSTRTRTSSR